MSTVATESAKDLHPFHVAVTVLPDHDCTAGELEDDGVVGDVLHVGSPLINCVMDSRTM